MDSFSSDMVWREEYEEWKKGDESFNNLDEYIGLANESQRNTFTQKK